MRYVTNSHIHEYSHTSACYISYKVCQVTHSTYEIWDMSRTLTYINISYKVCQVTHSTYLIWDITCTCVRVLMYVRVRDISHMCAHILSPYMRYNMHLSYYICDTSRTWHTSTCQVAPYTLISCSHELDISCRHELDICRHVKSRYIPTYLVACSSFPSSTSYSYGVATISRLLKIIGLFCRV